MLLFEKYNIAYLHINKTGGSSVKAFLRDVFGEEGKVIGNYYNINAGHPRVHEALYDKKIALGSKFYKTRILTTIRNPYARWVSLYHARRRNYYEKGKEGRYIFETLNRTFEEWLSECIIYNANPFILNCSLKKYLFVNGLIPANLYITKLEDIERGLKNFLKINGIVTDLEIPHKNISKHDYFMDYYNDAVLIKKIYEQDKFVIDTYYPEFKCGV